MGDVELERGAIETIEAFNRGDWDRMRELYTADTVYEETGTGNRLVGIEDLLAGLRSWKDAMPDVEGDVSRVLSDGETVLLEITWRGTQSGPLVTPGGTLPASGRTFSMDAALIQRWVGGRVAHERHHLDMLALLTQIGAIPAPA